MDYQEYKKEFLESLRNDSAINGTDTEDEFVYATVKGFERETGIQRAYYYLCGALIIGAVFFLLPSRSKKNHEGRH